MQVKRHTIVSNCQTAHTLTIIATVMVAYSRPSRQSKCKFRDIVVTYLETYDMLSRFPRTDGALDFPKTYRDAMLGDGESEAIILYNAYRRPYRKTSLSEEFSMIVISERRKLLEREMCDFVCLYDDGVEEGIYRE